ncbi:MAG: SapC family protein [Oceanicaulis sp.]
MADAPASQATVQGSLPLYKQPEPLNVQQHKGKGLKFGDRPFEFLRDTHFVPVTVGEFASAGARFPLIFLGDNKTPVAAMGLRQGANLFVDEHGQFEAHTYMPAFIRRYPFVAATHPDAKERFTVCVDAGSHLISDKPDEPFFTEDGQPTEFTNRAIDFVRRFESDVQTTQAFVERLKELDLFDQQQATFQQRDSKGEPVGEPQVVASYWSISGEKLKALDPKVLAELRDDAALGAIYAVMLSMSQWDVLISRAARRQQAPGAADAPMAPPPPAPEA